MKTVAIRCLIHEPGVEFYSKLLKLTGPDIRKLKKIAKKESEDLQ